MTASFWSPQQATASPIVWETASDWNNAVSQSGAYAQSVTDTDYGDSALLRQAWDYANFSEITPDPAAVYPLHEDSGSTAYDIVGGDNGTISGPTLSIDAPLGVTGYSFDGTDDLVTPSAAHLASQSAWTWTCWARNISGGRNSMVYTENQGGSGSRILIYIGDTNNSSTPSVRFRVSGTVLIEGEDFSDNNWHHVAIVKRADNDWELFVDGSSVGTSTTSKSTFSASDTELGGSAVFGQYGNNELAGVRLYQTDLSNTEVSTLYNTVATAGSLETGTKSFNTSQTPDLSVSGLTLDGATDMAVDVIGSPSGTSETNTVQVTGDGTYSITWNNSHTDFRVRPQPHNEGTVTRGVSINSLELQP
jgi:hypothetical protein